MEFIGVTRAIHQVVYMLFNGLAIILWRVDASLIGVSMLSYGTQDWLTGSAGGGVWLVLDQLMGGYLGLETWKFFVWLALILFGLSLVARPFFSFRVVALGRLLFFGGLTYIFISQGVTMMQNLETWRGEAGSVVYTAMGGNGAVSISIPGGGGTGDEPIKPIPANGLDGQSPLRGWEAVSIAYFLATDADDLHQGVPPPDFRETYCLYDPATPIDQQTAVNTEGCSPQLAWDEWDLVATPAITQVWGIPLPGGGLSLDLPLYQEHPENRELGIRQAQAGVARLALGAVVALYPIVEANVSLMLTLASSFIYLSMPVALLFSFFLPTESIVTRLLMQYITIFIRTLIINGLVALFLLILMGAAANASLTVYLGLVGVGLAGGLFLTRMAAGTMRESLSQSMSAVGGIWMGAATTALGEGARRPAEMALGAAKVGASGATLAATASSPAGTWSALDMAEPGYTTARSGMRDLRGRSSGTDNGMLRRGRLPHSIGRFVKPGNRPDDAPLAIEPTLGRRSPGTNGKGRDKSKNGRPDNPLAAIASIPGRPPNGKKMGVGKPGDAVEAWVGQVYEARKQGRGRKQAAAAGRELLGQELAGQSQQAMSRHSRAETMAVVQAAREIAKAEGAEKFFGQNGRMKPEAVTAVRARLGSVGRAFQGQQGQRDLAALAASGMQPRRQAKPEAFRQAMSQAKAGPGEQPGRKVPRALGLDPVAAGEHFANLNRFAKVSEQAGLRPEQRQRLLKEAQAGRVTADTKQQIETMLRQRQRQGQAAGLKVEDVLASAQAMPATLQGPMAVKLPAEKKKKENEVRDEKTN